MSPGHRTRYRFGSIALSLAVAAVVLLFAIGIAGAAIRASYFYSYMNPDHLDSLARRGVNRAVIKNIQDSLGTRGLDEYQGFLARAPGLGVEIVPEWSLQAASRLAALPTTRRYTWGSTVEPNVGCPADSLFWRSALRDRAAELIAALPSLHHLALDLEIYTGSLHHYDAGPCQCAACQTEFATRPPGAPGDLGAFQEQRVAAIVEALLRELAGSRPGLELDVFDLDFDSFVHRGFVRALVRVGLPTTDYCERSYAGAANLPAVRAELDSMGLTAPLVGGLQLKNFTPASLVDAADAVLGAAGGYFIFTSYSLWQAPSNLTGPYVLQGSQADYWEALRAINGAPGAVPLPEGNPGKLRLRAPRPNPSASSCSIPFDLDAPADVTLHVLDVAGREIRRIEARGRSAGEHAIRWDGRDAAGSILGSGTYLVRIEALGESRAVRLTRLR